MGPGDEQYQSGGPAGNPEQGTDALHASSDLPGTPAAGGATPREFGERLISVTESIQRELEQLRQVSSEQERREVALAEREVKVQARERKLADAAEALRSAKGEYEQQRTSLAAREADITTRTETARDLLAQAQQKESALAQREESAKAQDSELTTLRQKIESAQQSLMQGERDLATGMERLAAQKKLLRDREQTVGEREATCDAREAEIAALEKSVSSASEAGRRIAELESRIREIQAERASSIESLNRDLEQARSKVAAAEDQCRALEVQAAGANSEHSSTEYEAEIARRDEALERVSERLRTAVANAQALEKQLAAARTQSGDGELDARMDEFCALRRDRLRRLKSMLEDRAKKVIRAREALAKKAAELEQARQAAPAADDSQREQLQLRLAEAEKVLTLRATLSERQAVLEKQARIVQRKIAKSPAGALMAAFAVMMAASAFGGWQIAGQFAQATFLVQSTIAMESAGGSTPPEHVQAWTNYHEDLAKDPQLLEKVAERMRRRGYNELGNATSLTARLREDLEVQPGARGELTLTLRGQGQARTEGVLDTFVGVLVQMGNDGRDRRLDRTAAVIKSGAKADTRPVGDPRLPLFGMITGGLAAVSMCVWFVAWRGLCKRSLISPDDTIDVT